MALKTISSFQLTPDWHYGGSTGKLRLYYSESFIDSEGRSVVGSQGFYEEVDITITSLVATVAEFQLVTTEDSDHPNAKVIGVLYDETEAQRDTLFEWSVPSNSTIASPTTRALMQAYNDRNTIINPVVYYQTQSQVITLVTAMLAAVGLAPATNLLAGIVKLSVAAADPANPIVFGTNDPDVRDALKWLGIELDATMGAPAANDVPIFNALTGKWEPDQAFAAVPAHASSHENGGTDEISVAGLSGLLADPQVAIPFPATQIVETSGPTTLDVDAIADGEFLKRVGAEIVSAPGGGSGAVQGIVQGRLTTESGVPVSTSDRTAQSTIYFTPYKGNQVSLYNGSAWAIHTFTERSLALSGLTSGKNYDVFLFDNAGTLTLELSAAWTNDTTRADALTLQDGVLVKSGATTRLYLGTIRTTSTTTTEDSGGITGTTQVGGKRFVWNYYNRVARSIAVVDLNDSWSYTGTWRQADGVATNQVEAVFGLAGEGLLDLSVIASIQNISNTTGTHAAVGIGVGSTTVPSGNFNERYFADASAHNGAVTCRYVSSVPLGYQFYAWIEQGAATGTSLFLGDNAGACRSGINGTIWN